MKIQPQRPVFQAVFKYRYPVTAIASVLHRISGVILFLVIPLLLWVLHKSLASAEGFQSVQHTLTRPLSVTILWIILTSLLYHLIAGIRHLLMDAGVGESKRGGKAGAYVVFVITIILLLILGVWL